MPDAIAHYKILEPLGAGGLGEVYRARDTRLGRTVAVKVLPSALTQDAGKLEALRDAVGRLISLSHPNIAMLFEIGEEGDRRYLVFEFVQGQPLASLINGRPLNLRRVLEFGINLADALADAHAAEMIHGDIRPDTIMITPKDRAKFMNFGLARYTAGGASRVGLSLPYVAPEEQTGKPADTRTDIYSLGAVMFEMLTGRQRTRGAVLSSVNPAVPAELEQIVARMLASNVDHRAQSAAAIAAELRSVAAILDTRTEAAEAAGVAEPVGRRSQPRRSNAIGFGIALLILAGVVVAWLMMQMIIETRSVPPFHKNGYVVGCERTRQAVVIDPGDEIGSLLEVIDRQSLTARMILLTHAHIDHVTGVGRAKDALDVPTYLHRDDQFLYDAAPQQAAYFGIQCDALPAVDRHYDLGRAIVARRLRDHRASHTRALSGRCVPRVWEGRTGEERSVCRRHALRGIDRPNRFAWRRLRDVDSDRSRRYCFRLVIRRTCIPGTVRSRPSARSAAPIPS